MSWSQVKWYLAAAALVFGPVGVRMLFWERARPLAVDREMAKSGEELFNHTWQIKDGLTPDGDGLGPVFNGRSCVACHNQGGPGGGGDVEHNVTTYVIQRDNEKPREGVLHSHAIDEQHRETLTYLDPTLPALSQVPLRQLLAMNEKGEDFLIQGNIPVKMGDGIEVGNVRANVAGALVIPPHIQLSQRNTPALFGSNLIDAIPERIILANERTQRLRHGNGREKPVGRVHRLPDGRIGRFGWKAQTARLSDFVEAACANELGLGNPNKEQPVSLATPNYRAPGNDLTQEQCDQLTAFVGGLSRPTERQPLGSAAQKSAASGKTLFSNIGCAECHTPALGSVDGIYSDLLLHRMGTKLAGAGRGYNAEPLPARPDSDGASENGAPLANEWRTPPLWGVADSAPYLHDGRAATLAQAIEMHDGHAALSAQLFRDLPPARRTQLLAFLGTLRAP